MSEQAELAFARTYLNTLATQPITYANDYQQPPENSLKRVPTFPVQLPPPPKRQHVESSGALSSAPTQFTLSFKSLKPPASYTLTVSPTDTIATIKSQLATTHPTAPPADAQRLLVKGKALADAKLLKEYNIQEGDTVNLMIKPGVNWDPTVPKAPPTMPNSSLSVENASSGPTTPARSSKGHKHSRTPSIVLSPSPSIDAQGTTAEKDILLTLDSSEDLPPPMATEVFSTYHRTISNPEYWEKLLEFLKSEFTTEVDALQAWEDYLRASKGALTASEIAKVRDVIGVVGMAGT